MDTCKGVCVCVSLYFTSMLSFIAFRTCWCFWRHLPFPTSLVDMRTCSNHGPFCSGNAGFGSKMVLFYSISTRFLLVPSSPDSPPSSKSARFLLAGSPRLARDFSLFPCLCLGTHSFFRSSNTIPYHDGSSHWCDERGNSQGKLVSLPMEMLRSESSFCA